MAAQKKKQFGLVLSAGGARAAYQVGVLNHLAKAFPKFQPTIFSGLSAGAINTTFLAQGEPFSESAPRLNKLWSELTFDKVFKTNFRSIFGVSTRILNDLFLSKITKRLLFRSVLDATPLAHTISTHIRFSKIWKAVCDGRVQGLAITATSYLDGTSTIFYDSTNPIPPWAGGQRRSVRTGIRIRHIMASCSIPILFEPIRIGDNLYGDGSIRQTYPFSPALRMGATHALGISVNGLQPALTKLSELHRPSLGFVAGVVLDSIFLDTLEPDFDMLTRFNAVAKQSDAVRHIHAELIRPSIDPGTIAKDHIEELPYHLRQLIRTTAIDPSESGELLSYLLFSPGYIRAMLSQGEKDAADQHEKLEKWIESEG